MIKSRCKATWTCKYSKDAGEKDKEELFFLDLILKGEKKIEIFQKLFMQFKTTHLVLVSMSEKNQSINRKQHIV